MPDGGQLEILSHGPPKRNAGAEDAGRRRTNADTPPGRAVRWLRTPISVVVSGVGAVRKGVGVEYHRLGRCEWTVTSRELPAPAHCYARQDKSE